MEVVVHLLLDPWILNFLFQLFLSDYVYSLRLEHMAEVSNHFSNKHVDGKPGQTLVCFNECVLFWREMVLSLNEELVAR